MGSCSLLFTSQKMEDETWEVVSNSSDNQDVASSLSSLRVSSVQRFPAARVRFFLNGKLVTVNNPDPAVMLSGYLRGIGLTGTKLSCWEGGCGACSVLLTCVDKIDGQKKDRVINACLRPLCSLDGMAVTTTEGLGNKQVGFHKVQTQIADGNGSQCGYCTPGWVMNMYGLLKENPHPTVADVEHRFDGNMCRCTGYRPILTAFKELACQHDANKVCADKGKCGDIEDLCGSKCHTSASRASDKSAEDLQRLCPSVDTFVATQCEDRSYFRAADLEHVLDILAKNAGQRYRFVVGNTSVGVVKYYDASPMDSAAMLIDISQVRELLSTSIVNEGYGFGAAVTIANLIQFLQKTYDSSTNDVRNSHLPAVLRHLHRIANVQVRNVSCWAGNLMIAKLHPAFASDFTTLFLALEAKLEILDLRTGRKSLVEMDEFLSDKFSMDFKLILSVTIPFAQQNEFFLSYKVSDRHQNAHALINAAFKLRLGQSANSRSYATPLSHVVMVFGGMETTATRATQTEQFLSSTGIGQTEFQHALTILEAEMFPLISQRRGKDEAVFKMAVIRNFFYKACLSILPAIPSRLLSATVPYERDISSGHQQFTVAEDLRPISEPIAKLTARSQAAGEIQYTTDIPNANNTLFGSYVLSTIISGTVDAVDPSEALQIPGVVDYICASDVPAANDVGMFPEDEELFATKVIGCKGQIIGLIVADTPEAAKMGADAVKVTYTEAAEPPVLTMEDAIARGSWLEATQFIPHNKEVVRGDVDAGFKDADFIIDFDDTYCRNDGQYHFYMETQNSYAIPQEDDNILIHCSSQGPSSVQNVLCRVLGLPMHKITVETRHVGGGFGGKLTRHLPHAAAAAVAARKTRRPVRIWLDRNLDMRISGRRHPFMSHYKVGFKKNGQITALHTKLYTQGGFVHDLTLPANNNAMMTMDNVYYIENYKAEGWCCKTNYPAFTTMRAPGVLQGVYLMETIIDHIARYLQAPVDDVRTVNLYQDGQSTPYGQVIHNFTLPAVLEQLKGQTDEQRRRSKIRDFNANNRWRKRAIATSTVKYPISLPDSQMGATVNIFAGDGTVLIVHSGCEIGQGIHTKVSQAAAFVLGVPMSKIQVSSLTSTAVIPNAALTGSSSTSEACCGAVKLACEELNSRLTPFKGDDKSWEEIVGSAAGGGVSLSATGWFAPAPAGGTDMFTYFVYGAATSEIELDVLSGEVTILRTDIVYDCGQSLNPAVDVGQIEGAFVQGIGFYLNEEIYYHLGNIENNGTWDYKPPFSADIPIEFNVSFLKDSPNPVGIFRSKASAEPPLMLSASVLFAVKEAIYEARKEMGMNGTVNIQVPAIPQRIQLALGVAPAHLNLQ
eukprot:GILK01004288.1.p1 GENE.GILK01004288.1~~GILK01004288.1.p1  ORF type:complete len:1351 (-),score=243.88 GILK01004288.1:135-4187(-)